MPASDGKKRPCVVLAGSSVGSTLHVARSLAPRGVSVLVASTVLGAAEVYRSSRHVAAAREVDPADPTAMVRHLAAWVASETGATDPAVVIPTSDRTYEALVRARGDLAPALVASLPAGQVALDLVDKVASTRIAERAGLDVPPWRRVADHADIAATRSLDLPVVVRPTRWSTSGASARKAEVVRDADRLATRLGEMVDEGAELIVQELVDAPDHAVEVAIVWRSSDGSTTAVCTGRKRRQSHPDGGVMVWGEASDLADVRADAIRFLDESGFVGVGGLEVIRQGGRRWFIEFNPRLEAIHFLATRAGVDTVGLLHSDLSGEGRPPDLPRQGPASAWVGSAWVDQIANDPARWSVALRDRWDFGRSPQRVRAVWSWSDPGPGLALLRAYARKGVARVARARARAGVVP